MNPSYIRTEADELTYCLHIMVRYELEKMLLRNQIEVKDLPSKWNELYQTYLGITPPTDTLGVLQDIHWAGGAIGYFFSYALGNAYSGQWWHQMNQELSVDDLLRQGNFKPIRAWLNERIHQHGSLYPPKELIQKGTNEAFNPQYYCDYLKNKYQKLYRISKKG